MKIRKISIKNFRGIKELDWSLPAAEIFCLIGKGDSSKSTVLEALRYAFYPQWNPIFTDADFYQCKVDNGIVIEVTLGDLTPEFCSDQKYGHHQRGWDKATQKLTDESDDHLESVLTVRLTIGKELEPKWIVVTDRTPEGVPFKQADRDRNDWDYQMPAEEVAQLTKNYSKVCTWEENRYVTQEDIKEKRYNVKTVQIMQAKVKGENAWDRIGDVRY
jgi:hypothetical protein